MTDTSQELKQVLNEVGWWLEKNGVRDCIIIGNREGESVTATKMSPQKALLYLIDSLQSAKDQCLKEERQTGDVTNNQ